jgi:hypothetical protein
MHYATTPKDKPLWRGPSDRNVPKAARTVRIYRNGDPFFAGKLIMIPLRTTQLSVFMDQVSDTLKQGKVPRFWDNTVYAR